MNISSPGRRTSASLRDDNRRRALTAIHLAGSEPVTRAALTRELGLTRATTGALVGDLVGRGLISEQPSAPTGTRGRPTTRLHPAPAGPVAVAVEIGVDALTVAEVGLAGHRLGHTVTELAGATPSAVCDALRPRLTAAHGRLGDRALGLGVAVYGLVDQATGTVIQAPNLGWTDVPLRDVLRQAWPGPIMLDNDATLAGLGEARRAHPHARSMLFLHSNVGLGGALVIDGQPVRGRRGFAGEFGHLPLADHALPCHCGATGCWELAVDQRALARAAGRPDAPHLAAATARGILRDAARDDLECRTAVETVARALGRGLGALVNATDPDLVVVSAHAAQLLERAPDVIASAMRSGAMAAHRDGLPPVVPSVLGDDGAILGAAEEVFAQTLLGRPR